jgi:hypothetical protein
MSLPSSGSKSKAGKKQHEATFAVCRLIFIRLQRYIPEERSDDALEDALDRM